MTWLEPFNSLSCQHKKVKCNNLINETKLLNLFFKIKQEIPHNKDGKVIRSGRFYYDRGTNSGKHLRIT